MGNYSTQAAQQFIIDILILLSGWNIGRFVVSHAVEYAACGPVAQLVRAGDSSKWCAHVERHGMNGMNSGKPYQLAEIKPQPKAILSQAKGTPLEGAETTWEL